MGVNEVTSVEQLVCGILHFKMKVVVICVEPHAHLKSIGNINMVRSAISSVNEKGSE